MKENNIHAVTIRTAFALWYGWRPYGRYAASLAQTQWWPWADIEQLQLQKLKALLQHAYCNVPFYRQQFEMAEITPDDICSVGDLRQLPLLTKTTIQKHQQELLATGINRHRLRENHTGGSTGQPLTFYQDANFIAWHDADLLRNYRMAQYQLGMRWAFLWGSDYDARAHKDWLGRLKDHIIYNLLWINTFDLTTDTLTRAAYRLANWQPQILVAYVSSATLLARLINAKNIRGIRPQAIQTSAEVLTSEDRLLLEETFSCPVFNRYGCREVGNIAHECEAHQGLHILAENNLLELIDNNGAPVAPGQVGRVVVTNLNNYAMPLIRYENGDMGIASAHACICGRGLPLLDSVVGRTIDTISSPSGKLLHGEFFTHLFYKVPGVAQFRVVQNTIRDLLVQIVPREGFDQQTAAVFLEKSIHQHGDPKFAIRFELHDYLPPASSGKYRFTVSHVPLQLVRS
jgi:phenylacetate-CoA ligase